MTTPDATTTTEREGDDGETLKGVGGKGSCVFCGAECAIGIALYRPDACQRCGIRNAPWAAEYLRRVEHALAYGITWRRGECPGYGPNPCDGSCARLVPSDDAEEEFPHGHACCQSEPCLGPSSVEETMPHEQNPGVLGAVREAKAQTKRIEGLLRDLAAAYPRELLHNIAISCASHIAAIDSDSAAVAAYIEQRFSPFAQSRFRLELDRIAKDGRSLPKSATPAPLSPAVAEAGERERELAEQVADITNLFCAVAGGARDEYDAIKKIRARYDELDRYRTGLCAGMYETADDVVARIEAGLGRTHGAEAERDQLRSENAELKKEVERLNQALQASETGRVLEQEALKAAAAEGRERSAELDKAKAQLTRGGHCRADDACRIEPCSCGCDGCVAARRPSQNELFLCDENARLTRELQAERERALAAVRLVDGARRSLQARASFNHPIWELNELQEAVVRLTSPPSAPSAKAEESEGGRGERFTRRVEAAGELEATVLASSALPTVEQPAAGGDAVTDAASVEPNEGHLDRALLKLSRAIVRVGEDDFGHLRGAVAEILEYLREERRNGR